MKERLARLPVIGTAMAVQERYKLDAADALAASIGFFGFLSLFPLLALAIAAAGFVLSDPQDQVEVALRLAEALPGFDQLLAEEDGAGVSTLISNVVAQRGAIGLVGAVTLLITGLKVVAAAMTATRVVFRTELETGVTYRVRQLAALVGLGLLALVSTAGPAVAGFIGSAFPSWVVWITSLVVTFLLDTGLFLAAYRLLSPSSELSLRELVPGALFAAAGWTVLKVGSASYVSGQVEDANALYGALGGVIALLLLLYLAGRLYLYGAELSAVRAEKARRAPLTPPADADDATPFHLKQLGVAQADADPRRSSRARSGDTAGDGPSTGPEPAPREAPSSQPPRTHTETHTIVTAGLFAAVAGLVLRRRARRRD